MCRAAFAAGRRDIQYKWKYLSDIPDVEDLHYATTDISVRHNEALAS